VLLPLVARTYRRIGSLHRRSERETAALDHDVLLHEIRKAAKRARYAGEALVPVHGAAAREWAARMEDIQEILGAHQDTVVVREHVRRLATEAHLAGEDTFTYGRLHALEQARATATAQAFQRIWLRASQPELHQWLKP
jgi:CHAD domain-containing protein